MSATPTTRIDHEPVGEVTPVRLAAASLDSTAPEYLRDCRAAFAAAGLAPVELAVRARFDEDCSLATQSEADRIREFVRAASFLGATRVTVEVEGEPPTDAVEPALAACAERARREGLTFEVEGAVSVEH